MIDWSKLNPRTPAERADDRARGEAGRAARRAEERRAGIGQTLTATLMGAPELRFLQDGTVAVAMRFREDADAALERASWETGGRAEAEAFLALPAVEAACGAGETDEGPRIVLAGRWVRRAWRKADGSTQAEWTFEAVTAALAGRAAHG